jgi:predicted site-specific integrase-resolvase
VLLRQRSIQEKAFINAKLNQYRVCCNDGRIYPTKAPGGERLYSKVDVSRVFGNFFRDFGNKKKICYARLSSDHRREKSQVGILDRFYPGTAIIKYTGSGLNFKKKKVYPFWSKPIQEKSKKLLSCTSTDCEDLVLDFWDSSAKKLLEVSLMDSTKKQQIGPAKITVLYSYSNLRPGGWFLKIAGKST